MQHKGKDIITIKTVKKQELMLWIGCVPGEQMACIAMVRTNEDAGWARDIDNSGSEFNLSR